MRVLTRRKAHGQDELNELFSGLGKSFSDYTSYAFELQAYDLVGDMACWWWAGGGELPSVPAR
jgi:hypothetical protein